MSNLGKVQSPPRPSSAGAREAVRIIRAMEPDNKEGLRLLSEMAKVQAHNEEVYKIAAATLDVADQRVADAEAAEQQQRDSARADAEALEAKEADLAEREAALGGQQEETKQQLREAADERRKHEEAVAEREEALQAGWAEQAQMKLTNDTRVEELGHRAASLDARQAEMNAYDSQLLDLIQSRAKTPQRSAGG